MRRWLLKSEPVKYAWDQMVADGRTHWNGVRNAQATNNMKAMAVGDPAFFYHSNEGLEIVGLVEIVKTFYLDPADESGRFGMVDVAARDKLAKPVTLKAMKAEPRLKELALIRQSRLSVVPVGEAEWSVIMEMAAGEMAAG